MLITLLVCSFAAYAQGTVTLVVNGEGATKAEATANALRSAIEQSFGVFVSSNTQILNDEIVKDEIATLASGNITEYTELGSVTLPDGSKSVSLSATVSINNLISYAKSKGSSTEFAGAVWGMNMKMRKLNAENERTAVAHMLENLEILSRDMFRIEMSESSTPVKINWDDYKYSHLKEIYSSQPYLVDFQLKYYSTPACKLFNDFLFKSLESISLSEDEVRAYRESGEPIYGLSFRQAVNEDIQIFGIGERDLNSTIAYSDHYSRGAKEFKLSVYYFRNNIAGDILSGIYKFFIDAQLSNWQIVRMSIDGKEDPVSFESIYRTAGRSSSNNSFEFYWRSYPKTKLVQWVNRNNGFGCNSFPFADIYNYHAFGEEQVRIVNMQKMLHDSSEMAACNIKIGFTEEELMNTTGFAIKKRECTKDKNAQPNNEIWYTNGSTTEPSLIYGLAVRGEDGQYVNQMSHTYDNAKKRWIISFDEKIAVISMARSDWESLSLPDSVTEIKASAFRGCDNLKSITLSKGITKIEENTFYRCNSLESITLPDNIEEIGNGAFEYCSSLKSVTIPKGVAKIGSAAFHNCSSLESIAVPNSVAEIGAYAFSGCSLLTSITIPGSVAEVGSRVFTGCSSLKKINIQNGVTKIGSFAFEDCVCLESISIPKSVTEISQGAFSGCANLEAISCHPLTPPVGDYKMLQGLPAECVIYVPASAVSAYQSDEEWNRYYNSIVEMP